MTEVIVIDSRDGVVCPHTPHVDGQGPGLCLRVVLPDVGEVLEVVKSTYKRSLSSSIDLVSAHLS